MTYLCWEFKTNGLTGLKVRTILWRDSRSRFISFIGLRRESTKVRKVTYYLAFHGIVTASEEGYQAKCDDIYIKTHTLFQSLHCNPSLTIRYRRSIYNLLYL